MVNRLNDINCAYCGKTFHPKNASTKFCCKECYSKSMVKVSVCEYCGNSFRNPHGQKYCSLDCFNKSRGSYSKETRICKLCGKEFTPENREQIYCSRECQWKSLRKLSDIQCEECGKTFRPKNKYTRFCSKKCMYDNKSKTYKNKWVSMPDAEKQKIINPLFDASNKNICSKINVKIGGTFKDMGYDVEYEKGVGLYHYDLYVGDTLIDINPFPYHNETRHPFNNPNGPKYHYYRKKNAIDNGYKCIMIWDWDDIDKVVNMFLKDKKHVYARKCRIAKLEYQDCHSFFETYHLQGDTAKNKNNIYIGLYYEGELVECMSFGKPRNNKNYEWEILRLCSHSGYEIVGGASKMFKYFIDITGTKSVISYCDMSKFDGNVYEQLGFTLLKRNAPSKHRYLSVKGLEGQVKHVTDNLLRSIGFDKLLGRSLGKFGKGTNNEQFMKEAGYVEIYDCGQATYVYSG